MAQWQTRSKRKKSGKLIHRLRKKKKMKRGRDYLPMHVGERKTRKIRTRGGGFKIITLSGDIANVSVKGKAQKTKILTVLENHGNNSDSAWRNLKND